MLNKYLYIIPLDITPFTTVIEHFEPVTLISNHQKNFNSVFIALARYQFKNKNLCLPFSSILQLNFIVQNIVGTDIFHLTDLLPYPRS